MVIFFFILKKNSTCICRNKKWQDCNLATNTQLVRFNGVSPGKDKYIRKNDFSNIQNMVYDGTITASFTKEKSILILMWWIPMQSYIQKNLFLSLVTGKKFQD